MGGISPPRNGGDFVILSQPGTYFLDYGSDADLLIYSGKIITNPDEEKETNWNSVKGGKDPYYYFEALNDPTVGVGNIGRIWYVDPIDSQTSTLNGKFATKIEILCDLKEGDKVIDSKSGRIFTLQCTNACECVWVAEKYNDVVKAAEESSGDFETTHILMNIPSGSPGDVTEHDVTWDMDILLWKTMLTPTTDMIGDTITVVGGPETTIGVLTSGVSISDTILNVNSTVFDYVKRGYLLTLDDTVNKDVLGRVTAIDSGAGTITVKTAASYAYNPGTPVKISLYILKDIYIPDINVIEIGGKGFKGKTVSQGTILRVYYTNNSGTSKIFRWRPEYYNNG